MGLFQDVFCVNCGVKTRMLARTKLKDGITLCNQCMNKVPVLWHSSIENYEEYKQYLEYTQICKEQMGSVFKPNHSYENLQIDTENGIFIIDSHDDNPAYLLFEDVAKFSLDFIPDEYKEGTFGDKVIGKVMLTLIMRSPYLLLEDVIKRDAKVSVKKSTFGNKFSYKHPEGMDEFAHYFLTACEIFQTDTDDEEE